MLMPDKVDLKAKKKKKTMKRFKNDKWFSSQRVYGF